MKGKVLAVGTVILIIGFLFFGIGYLLIQQYGTLGGSLVGALFPEAQNRYYAGVGLTLVGGILAIVGIVTCIY